MNIKALVLAASVMAWVITPTPARADPVTALATTVFTWAGASAMALASFTVGLGAQLLSMAIFKPESAKAPRVSLEVMMGEKTPIFFQVGDAVTAGAIKYSGQWGKNGRMLTYVYELSCIPIAGVEEVWVDDAKANINYAAPDYVNGKLRGYPITNYNRGTIAHAWIKFIDGTQTTADPFLVEWFANDQYPWNNTAVGVGKAYAVVTFGYSQKSMSSPPSLLFRMKPRPMYDPRKDSTAGGSGSHRWGVYSTYEPSVNAAVINYNIARGIYFGDEWIFGGRNYAAWRLPFAEWVAAMNACDVAITTSGGGTEPAYRAGTEIQGDMEALTVMESIGAAANMRFAEVGGRLKPIVGIPTVPALTITDADIQLSEGQTLAPFRESSDVYNAITATYPDPVEKWADKETAQYIDTAALAADRGHYRPITVQYTCCPFPNQAQRLQRLQLSDYRRQVVANFYLPPDAYRLEPGVDVIAWTSAENGFTNKLFAVESVGKLPGMAVAVALREVDPSDWGWNPAWHIPVTQVPPSNIIDFTQTVSDFQVASVPFVGSDGQARPGIQVTCAGDEVGVTDIRIRVRLAGQTDILMDVTRPWEQAGPWVWLLLGFIPDTNYEVQVSLLSVLTPISEFSEWKPVKTLNLRITEQDLSEQLQETLDEFHDFINVDILNLTERYRELTDEIRAIAGEVMEGTATRLEAEKQIRDYLATATYTLGVQITANDDEIRIISAAVTALKSVVPNLATAEAMQALSSLVTSQGDTIQAQAQSIIALSAELAGKASAVALQDLTAVVTQNGDDIDSVTTAITGVESRLDATDEDVATAAAAAASAATLAGSKGKVMTQTATPAVADRLAQNLWIDITGGANTPKRWNGSAWVAVTDKVATDAAAAAANALAASQANATATTNLTTRVSTAEGNITANADATTALQTTVGRFSASGLFRVRTEATPSGALSRIAIVAAATSGEGNTRSAAMYLEAVSGSKSRAIFEVDTFAIAGSSGAAFPFIVDGGVVYIDIARIKNLSVDTIKIADAAVTNFYSTSYSGNHLLYSGGERALLTLSFSANAGERAILFACYRLVTWRRGAGTNSLTAITTMNFNGVNIPSGGRNKTVTSDENTISPVVEWVVVAVSRDITTTGTQTFQLRGDGTVPNGTSEAQAGIIELIGIKVKK